MPRDLPDYGALSAQATVYEVTDLGELAVRLGSIDTFDRRGDVIFLDSFEDGLNKWGSSAIGTGGSVALSNARVRNGCYSCLLTCGSDLARFASIYHYRPIPAVSILGMEFSFNLASNISRLMLIGWFYTGTQRVGFRITWRDTEGTLKYIDENGDEIEFASAVVLAQDPTLFHIMKLVIDPETPRYVRFILDSEEYDLSAGSLLVSADATLAKLFVNVYLEGRAGQNDAVYVDDVIITQNEPAQP